MHKKTLEQLYQEHAGKVSDKWSLYLTEYDRVLKEYRDRPIRMLEIGIQNGGSLEIWSKYFPEAQKLVGCDIDPNCALLSYEDPRIAVVIGDANSDETQTKICEQASSFDVIIDDGSHRSGDIVRSFARYFPYLLDGGVYVVEDLHCSYWQEFDGGLFDPFSSVAFFKRLADIINYENWGVGRSSVSVLNGFFSRYGFEIDEDILAHVHAVEFINSVCIIRKNGPVHNKLGGRFVSGLLEVVAPGHMGLHLSCNKVENQVNNIWAMRSMPPEEELLIRLKDLDDRENEIDNLKKIVADLEVKLAKLTLAINERESHSEKLSRTVAEREVALSEREQQILGMLSSTSWYLTRPARLLVYQVKRVRHLWHLAPKIVNHIGSFGGAFAITARVYRREGIAGIKYRLRRFQEISKSIADSSSSSSNSFAFGNDYSEWIRRYDTMSEEGRVKIHMAIQGFEDQPLISVIMPCYNPKPEWLIEAIESVRRQIYPHWELCIADDASTNLAVKNILNEYVQKDERIKVVFRSSNGHISLASNSALEISRGQYIALLDHDDLLSEHALFWVVEAINRHPNAGLVYSDEDKITASGRRIDPYFKCEWNYDLFLSQNMISHLGVYRADLVNKVGGFRQGVEGSQDWDLALRCIELIDASQIIHVPKVLYHWRVHPESTAMTGQEAKPYAYVSAKRALNEHLIRTGVEGRAELLPEIQMFRVHYNLPDSPPLVSLIIPTRNGLSLIRKCLSSILGKTGYPNYEILIIDNGSDDFETLNYFESIKQDRRVRVLRDDGPFNFSALNNRAVDVAQGDFIGFVNNDVEVINSDWLSEMISIALQPSVGAVGARLWYPDNTLQHGGVVLGLGGIAAHSHRFLPRGNPGYFGRAALLQSFSAVTAACMVLRKSIFLDIGGFDEKNLKISYNDVDLCLRILKAGYRNVWTPYAELYHQESASRTPDGDPKRWPDHAIEFAFMGEQWREFILNDPAYSPNLTLEREDFSYAWPPRVKMLP